MTQSLALPSLASCRPARSSVASRPLAAEILKTMTGNLKEQAERGTRKKYLKFSDWIGDHRAASPGPGCGELP